MSSGASDARIARIAASIANIQGGAQPPSFSGPSIPSSGISVGYKNTGPTCWVPVFTGPSCMVTEIALSGVQTGLTMAASSQLPIVVPSGATVELVWSGSGHPTWPNWFPFND